MTATENIPSTETNKENPITDTVAGQIEAIVEVLMAAVDALVRGEEKK